MADDKSKTPPVEPKLTDFTELVKDDLTDDDMADIQALLEQKQDVTRQDIKAQDFQSILSKYNSNKE